MTIHWSVRGVCFFPSSIPIAVGRFILSFTWMSPISGVCVVYKIRCAHTIQCLTWDVCITACWAISVAANCNWWSSFNILNNNLSFEKKKCDFCAFQCQNNQLKRRRRTTTTNEIVCEWHFKISSVLATATAKSQAMECYKKRAKYRFNARLWRQPCKCMHSVNAWHGEAFPLHSRGFCTVTIARSEYNQYTHMQHITISHII